MMNVRIHCGSSGRYLILDGYGTHRQMLLPNDLDAVAGALKLAEDEQARAHEALARSVMLREAAERLQEQAAEHLAEKQSGGRS